MAFPGSSGWASALVPIAGLRTHDSGPIGDGLQWAYSRTRLWGVHDIHRTLALLRLGRQLAYLPRVSRVTALTVCRKLSSTGDCADFR